MLISKKSLGPVLATGLFIVVAIVATISFQVWFQDYSSQVFADIESDSTISEDLEVLDIRDSMIYVRSNNDKILSDVDIFIDGDMCTLEDVELEAGLNTIYLDECLRNLDSSGVNEIMLESEDKIYSKEFYISEENTWEEIEVTQELDFGDDIYESNNLDVDQDEKLSNKPSEENGFNDNFETFDYDRWNPRSDADYSITSDGLRMTAHDDYPETYIDSEEEYVLRNLSVETSWEINEGTNRGWYLRFDDRSDFSIRVYDTGLRVYTDGERVDDWTVEEGKVYDFRIEVDEKGQADFYYEDDNFYSSTLEKEKGSLVLGDPGTSRDVTGTYHHISIEYYYVDGDAVFKPISLEEFDRIFELDINLDNKNDDLVSYEIGISNDRENPPQEWKKDYNLSEIEEYEYLWLRTEVSPIDNHDKNYIDNIELYIDGVMS